MRLTVEGDSSFSELESLNEWLSEVDELRGRVRPVEVPPPIGALGPVLDALDVALGPGGAAAAVATSVIAWLRNRVGSVQVRLERSDGTEIMLDATKIRGLASADVQLQLEQLLQAIEPRDDDMQA